MHFRVICIMAATATEGGAGGESLDIKASEALAPEFFEKAGSRFEGNPMVCAAEFSPVRQVTRVADLYRLVCQLLPCCNCVCVAV